MIGRTLAAALAVAALGAGAWLLLRTEPLPGTGGGPAGGAGPGGAGPEEAPGAPGEAGAAGPAAGGEEGPAFLPGIVLRDGRPAPARVVAHLLARGPERSGSADEWDDLDPSDTVLDALDPEPRGTAEAGADGRWRMEGLGPGWYLFEAVAADGARGRATAGLGPRGTLPRKPGEPPGRVAIGLGPAGCVLRGRAFHGDGRPFAGLVGVHLPGGAGVPLGMPVKPDREGRFRLEGLPPSRVRLFAADPGRLVVRGPPVLLPCEEEVPFPVDGDLRDLEGRVLEARDGRPVPGALVTVTLDEWGEVFGCRAVTDPEGRYRVRAEKGRDVYFTVRAKGFVPLETSVGDPPGTGGPALEFRVERTTALSGRVLDAASGAPVPGALVVLARLFADGTVDEEGPLKATADGQGRYLLEDLRPGPAVVLAAGPGRVSRGFDPGGGWSEAGDMVVRLEGGVPAVKDLLLGPAPRARGRVVDGEGRGVRGIGVEARAASEADDGETWLLLSSGVEGKALSGEDGAFAIPALLPGLAYRLWARRDGALVASAGPFAAAPGADVEATIVLPPERSLEVRVTDASGATPIPEAGVEVILGEEGGAGGLGPTWWTDASGSARVGPLPAGELDVRAWTRLPGEDRWVDASESVEAGAAGPVLLRLAVVPPAAGATLEGRVVLPGGAPAPEASLEFAREGSELSVLEGVASTDFRGRFRVALSAEGEVEASADLSTGGRWYSGKGKAETGTASFLLELSPGGATDRDDEGEGPRVFVRVKGPGGAAVVRAEAAFHFLDREGKEEGDRERPVKDGRCVGRLPDDVEETPRFLLEVWGAVDGDGRPAGIGHALFGPFPTAPGDLEVTLPPGRTLEGRVVDADGNGITGISVSAEDAEEVCDGDFSATTESGGRFRIEGVGDREYRVSVCPPRWAQPMPAPLVARGGAADLLLALRAGEAFRVRVLDPDGRALAGARVTARVDGEIRDGWRMTTNALGVARLAGFAPGATGDLQVEPPDGRDDLLPLEGEAWRPADGDVRLARGYVLEVRVQDGQGRPVPEAWVIHSLEEGDGSWTWEETSEEGTLRLVRLPPGRIRLRARLQESKEEADGEGYPTTTASTGAGKVALVLDPGGEVRLRLKDGQGVQAWVTAAIPGETEPSIGLRFRGTEEGRFRGVPAGKTCDLYVVDSKQRCAVLRGVSPGGGVLEVPLAPGREIEGRCLLPAEGVRRRRIALLVGDAALIGSERFQEDGSFRFRSVPEGRWKVRVVLTLSRPEGGTTEKVVLAEAEPGQPLEIDAR